MSKNISTIQKSLLKKIADAIRIKTGITRKIKVTEYPTLIRQIDGGSSEEYDISFIQCILGRTLVTEDDLMTTDLVVPEGIEKIDVNAFSNTKITSITLPSTLTYMKGNSSVFSNCTALKEMTFLGDWNSNIVAPNLSNLETIYCHSWYYDKYKATTSAYYISSKLKCLHDTDLIELIIDGLSDSYQQGVSHQLRVLYNEHDCAYDEQRGVIWSIEGEGATITQSGFLEVAEDAVYGTSFKVKCVSKYDPSISFEKECKLIEAIVIYDHGYESETYKLIQQNSGTSVIKRNSDNITIQTNSGVYADLTTAVKVNVSGLNEVVFYGKISAQNPENGFVFLTNDATTKHNSSYRVREVKLNTTLSYYNIDVSDLDGEYYIGFAGSNRTVTCYQLKVV